MRVRVRIVRVRIGGHVELYSRGSSACCTAVA